MDVKSNEEMIKSDVNNHFEHAFWRKKKTVYKIIKCL